MAKTKLTIFERALWRFIAKHGVVDDSMTFSDRANYHKYLAEWIAVDDGTKVVLFKDNMVLKERWFK